MRLTCPNCGAQYQVRDDLIPDDGRDVQCSNCGNTWFFNPHEPEEDEALFTGLDADQHDSSSTESDAVDHDDWAEPEIDEPLDDPEDADFSAEPKDSDPSADFAAEEGEDGPKPSLSDEAADILRSEAAREAAKRIEERAPLETQTEMGLEEGSAPRPTPTFEAEVESDTPSPAAVAAASVGAVVDRENRASLLPDIEEINSTLRATTERSDLDPPSSAEVELLRQRRGFRYGFGAVVLLIAAAMILYARAPDVIATAPGFEPQITAYVDLINGWRVSLDQAVNGLLERLENLGA